jgi:Protein of unknown function (DUF3277)
MTSPSTRVAAYGVDDVTISLANFNIDGGLDDGVFCTVEMAAKDIAAKVGADGEVAIAKLLNKSGTAKIKLLQTSLTNNRLSALRQQAIDLPSGSGVGVFQVVDRSMGGTLVSARKAWIVGPPTLSRGTEVQVYEWEIGFANATLVIQGNPGL